MKRFCVVAAAAVLALCAASRAVADSVSLRYGFKPGQQWVCTRLAHTEFMVLGKKQTQRTKHTIAYAVSKGPRKGWVHLSARYIDPPPRTEDNQFALALYDLTFHADVHRSGDTRAVRVEGVEKPVPDPRLDAAAQASMLPGRRMLADAHKAAVFWFPELPETSLAAGDEFEFKQTYKMDHQMMASTAQTRLDFTLDDVDQGLAYFDLKEKTVGMSKTMGGQVTTKGAGKGETIFDLRSGMWIELVIRRRMRVDGMPFGGSDGQDMQMMEKIEMHLR